MTFLQFCQAQGILIDATPPMGVWKRYKTLDKPAHRNGAVKFMGDHGFVRNWATDSEASVWQEEGRDTQAKPIDMARINAQRDRERAYRIQAVRSARAFWNAATPLSLHHPYLDAKGLSPLGCSGLRTHDGLLVIPVMLGDALVSVQTIAPNGNKRFWPGAPVSSGALVIRRPRSAITVLCEGLATGLALFQSVRSASVVVCFDAGNMVKVAAHMRPTGSVVVFGDNDSKTMVKIGKNPGLNAARNTADLLGSGVAWCAGIEGNDADDYLREVGEGAARRLERLVLAAVKYVPAH
jgi:putative DNA primase/helicase